MTREEAIEIVKSAFSAWESEFRVPNDDWSEEHEALDMAIEALEREQQRQEDIYECQYCFGEVHKNYTYCPFCGERNAPTIDAVPKHQLSEETSTLDICPYYHHELTGEPFCEMEDRRHGTWKDIDGDGHYWECSACGEVLCCNNNFCPNCGAKMDGERSKE